MIASRTLWFGVVTLFVVAVVVNATPDENKPSEKRKRQIFREQVLPHAGGKIPADAFRADRLALNRLNKDGIAIPDGVLLDARRHDKHPHVGHNSDLEMSVIKVVLTPDGRYVPPEGKYNDNNPQTIDSTYIIRPPIGSYTHEFRRPKLHHVHLPVPAKLEIPAQVAAPTPLPGFNPYDFGFAPPSNFVFQNHNEFFPDYFHPFYTAQGPPYESFFHGFNQERFARQADKNRVKFPTDEATVERPQPQRAQQKQRVQRPGFKPSPVDASINCNDVGRNEGKMFADLEKMCQEFFVCKKGGRKDKFACPKGSLFNNSLRRCDWWQNVRCR